MAFSTLRVGLLVAINLNECDLCRGAAAFSPGADSWSGSFLGLLSVGIDWQQGFLSLTSSCFQAGFISCLELVL